MQNCLKVLLVLACVAHATAFTTSMMMKGNVNRCASVSARRPVRSGMLALRSMADSSPSTSAINEYGDGKMSLAEKEKLYLDCCAAYNVEKKSLITDDEFEQLKEDLGFEGSKVILMQRDEIKFMVATMKFNEGSPIMDDKEYDSLRSTLKARNSPAVVFDMPRCRIGDDGETQCKADITPDEGKNALLYTPALVLSALVFNELTFWTQHWDPLLSLILGSPIIAGATYVLTKYIYFQDPYITKCQCPECASPQNIYFGDILFVNGGKPTEIVKTQCINKACGAELEANREKMFVLSMKKK